MSEQLILTPVLRPDRAIAEPHEARVLSFVIRRVITIVLAALSLFLLFSTEPALPANSENALLLERAAALLAPGEHDWLVELYPPIPLLIALLTPAATGPVVLGGIGALAGGHLMLALLRSLWHRHMPPALIVLLAAVLIFSPVFGVLMVSNLPVALAITGFGLSVKYMVRFIVWNDTRAGFTAGALMLFAGFCDPLALVASALLTLTLPLLKHIQRTHPERPGRGVRRANTMVLLFPVTAGLAAWAVWSIIFSPGTLWAHTMGLLQDTAARFATFVAALAPPAGFLLYGTIVTAVIASIVVKNAEIVVGSVFVFLTVATGYIFGLVTHGGLGLIFIIDMILLMGLLRPPKSTLRTVLLSLTLVLLYVLTWYAFTDPAVTFT